MSWTENISTSIIQLIVHCFVCITWGIHVHVQYTDPCRCFLRVLRLYTIVFFYRMQTNNLPVKQTTTKLLYPPPPRTSKVDLITGDRADLSNVFVREFGILIRITSWFGYYFHPISTKLAWIQVDARVKLKVLKYKQSYKPILIKIYN